MMCHMMTADRDVAVADRDVVVADQDRRSIMEFQIGNSF